MTLKEMQTSLNSGNSPVQSSGLNSKWSCSVGPNIMDVVCLAHGASTPDGK